MFFNYLLNKISIFKTKVKILKYNNDNKPGMKKYDDKFINYLRNQNRSILLNTYDRFNFVLDSNIQYTQADILVAAINFVEKFTKPNRNFLNIESLLLDFCIELLMFMKPNTVLMMYAIASPFFDLEELYFIPSLPCVKGSMKFIEVDLFNVDYFLYKLNPGFDYIGECF